MIEMLLLAILAIPGDIVSFNLNESAYLSVSSNCLFLDSTFADPGEHYLYVGFNCSAGKYFLLVNGTEFLDLEVKEVNESQIISSATNYQTKFIKLKGQLKGYEEALSELSKRVNEIEKEKSMLEVQNKLLNDNIERLQLDLAKMKSELTSKTSEIQDLRSQIESVSGENQIYRAIALFLIALFAGSYVAIIYQAKKF